MSKRPYFTEERDFLKDVVLLLPAVHFLVCFIYLSVYFISFGSGLESYGSPTDIFSVSFSSIVPFYVGFAVPQLIFAAANIRRYSVLPPDTEFVEPPYASTLMRGLYVFAIISFALGVIEFSVTGLFPIYFVMTTVLCVLVPWLPKILENRPVHLREIVSGSLFGIIFLISTSMYQAQRDRYHPTDELSSSLSCRDFKILRPLAQNFLAAHRNGQRAVISEKCTVLAVVAKPSRPYVNTSEAMAIWARDILAKIS